MSDRISETATIERLQKQVGELQCERARLLDGVRYWSYCMDVGMRRECPEKVEELADFLIWCKVAPYSMRGLCAGGRGA